MSSSASSAGPAAAAAGPEPEAGPARLNPLYNIFNKMLLFTPNIFPYNFVYISNVPAFINIPGTVIPKNDGEPYISSIFKYIIAQLPHRNIEKNVPNMSLAQVEEELVSNTFVKKMAAGSLEQIYTNFKK